MLLYERQLRANLHARESIKQARQHERQQHQQRALDRKEKQMHQLHSIYAHTNAYCSPRHSPRQVQAQSVTRAPRIGIGEVSQASVAAGRTKQTHRSGVGEHTAHTVAQAPVDKALDHKPSSTDAPHAIVPHTHAHTDTDTAVERARAYAHQLISSDRTRAHMPTHVLIHGEMSTDMATDSNSHPPSARAPHNEKRQHQLVHQTASPKPLVPVPVPVPVPVQEVAVQHAEHMVDAMPRPKTAPDPVGALTWYDGSVTPLITPPKVPPPCLFSLSSGTATVVCNPLMTSV